MRFSCIFSSLFLYRATADKPDLFLVPWRGGEKCGIRANRILFIQLRSRPHNMWLIIAFQLEIIKFFKGVGGHWFRYTHFSRCSVPLYYKATIFVFFLLLITLLVCTKRVTKMYSILFIFAVKCPDPGYCLAYSTVECRALTWPTVNVASFCLYMNSFTNPFLLYKLRMVRLLLNFLVDRVSTKVIFYFRRNRISNEIYANFVEISMFRFSGISI
jgi:hypothetical protein